MSITDSRPHKPGSRESASGPAKTRQRIILAVGLAVVVALVVGGTLWAVLGNKTSSEDVPPPTAPITLPTKIGGYAAAPSDTDFANQPAWIDKAKAAAPNATVAGRSYGSAQLRRQIRVVAGRADLTKKLEFTWPADAGTTVESDLGEAHCTQNLKLVERSAAAVRPTMMFCSRITPALSAYAVIIDFDHHPTAAEGTAALDETWKAAMTGK